MTHATLRPEFEDLIDPYAPVGQIGTGFTFTEGPIWHPVDHYLLFSDMPADVRRRWDDRTRRRRGQAAVEQMQRHDLRRRPQPDRLRACDLVAVRERPDGRREVLASHFERQELNSPNDVCVRSDGSIYFSDPWYGRMPVYGVERPRQLGFQGVYRVPPGGGAPQLLVDRFLFDQPNGLCFSPDEKLLYVNDTVQALIRVFDVAADGSLSNGRIFATGIRSSLEPGVPDGMKCDQRGNVWVTAPGRRLGLCAQRRPPGQGARSRTRRQSCLGRRRLSHALHDRDAFGLPGHDQSRAAARALYDGDRRRSGFRAAARRPRRGRLRLRRRWPRT